MTGQVLWAAGLPALLFGAPSPKVWLFIHGKDGSKEEAADLARLACPLGWQVLGVDLPGHGCRKGEADRFTPWQVTPELQGLFRYARQRWARVALRANSIGAWFSMLALEDTPPAQALFVSPILDMEELIGRMMGWAGVTEAELRARQTIPTDFGETLSWQYLEYARRHPITGWAAPTAILYAGQDELTPRATVERFSGRFGCRLQIMEEGEHWFHTPEQLAVLDGWTSEALAAGAAKQGPQ